MNLRNKKEKLEIDLYKLNNRMEYALDSDSIKFYEKLKPFSILEMTSSLKNWN